MNSAGSTESDQGDVKFLERVFQKLLLNFTWWVNRKDDRMRPQYFPGRFPGAWTTSEFSTAANRCPTGALSWSNPTRTSWMAMYALNLMQNRAGTRLVQSRCTRILPASFLEHFLAIAQRDENARPAEPSPLWNEEDGLFYDHIHLPDGGSLPLRIHSMVSLIPLYAVEVIDADLLDKFSGFGSRFRWFMENRPELTVNVSRHLDEKRGGKLMLSIVDEGQLRQMLNKMLDEKEFLSPYGIRSLSKYHEEHPYELDINGVKYTVDYNPGESKTGLFGGNSNWRGPIWMPVNYLIIESLQKFHYYFGDDLKVECPVGSGRMMTLWEVSEELSRRLERIFRRDPVTGQRAVFGPYQKFQHDPHWNRHPFFHEYFHADEGRGCGASHQTGWTGLIAKLFQQTGEYQAQSPSPQA